MTNEKDKTIDIITTPYEQWKLNTYRQIYVDDINIDNDELKKIIVNIPLEQWKYGSINRYDTYFSSVYGINVNSVNNIGVAYKITYPREIDQSVIYSLAYLSPSTKYRKTFNDELYKKYGSKMSISSNLINEGVCCSGSMISKDGEYRSGLINWNITNIIIKKDENLHTIFKYIKDYLMNFIRNGEYILRTEYFFPNLSIRNKYYYETELVSNRRRMDYFVITWYRFFYSYSNGILTAHINEEFKDVMTKYQKRHTEFFKSLWIKFNENDLEKLRYIFSEFILSEDLSLYKKNKFGQKLVPLSLLDVQNFFSLETSSWRELLINHRLTNLVLNNITNGFAINSKWFLLKFSDMGMFDNPKQKDRLNRSDLAIKILEVLNQAHFYSKLTVEEFKNTLNVLQSEISTPFSGQVNTDETKEKLISNEMREITKSIKNLVEYIKDNVIMSNVCLVMTNEFVGKTLYDSIFLTQSSKQYSKIVPYMFSPHSYSYFRKYMFELCYNFYVLNTKAGVIHNDIHLNNITINSIFYTRKVDVKIKSPKNIYIVDDHRQYIFDTDLHNLCIIDFSRAIINPEFVNTFSLNPFHEYFNILQNKKKFSRLQYDTLLYYYTTLKPEFRTKEVYLFEMIENNPNVFFKLFSVLDLFNITLKLIDFFSNADKYNKKIHPASEALVLDINKLCDYYLTVTVNKLINLKTYEEVITMDHPLLKIIDEIFADELLIKNPDKIHHTIDIYNCNNEEKFNIETVDNFSPIMTEYNELNNKKDPIKTDRIKAFVAQQKLVEKRNKDNIDTILYIMKRQIERAII